MGAEQLNISQHLSTDRVTHKHFHLTWLFNENNKPHDSTLTHDIVKVRLLFSLAVLCVCHFSVQILSSYFDSLYSAL